MSEKHSIGLGTYFAVFGALMAFTALTVWVAFQDFGVFNNVIALGIAVIKATLVVLFFMHVIHSTPLIKVTLVSSLFFFLLLIAFVFADVWTRGMFDHPASPPMIGG